jgi:hypothetical protein
MMNLAHYLESLHDWAFGTAASAHLIIKLQFIQVWQGLHCFSTFDKILDHIWHNLEVAVRLSCLN